MFIHCVLSITLSYNTPGARNPIKVNWRQLPSCTSYTTKLECDAQSRKLDKFTLPHMAAHETECLLHTNVHTLFSFKFNFLETQRKPDDDDNCIFLCNPELFACI